MYSKMIRGAQLSKLNTYQLTKFKYRIYSPFLIRNNFFSSLNKNDKINNSSLKKPSTIFEQFKDKISLESNENKWNLSMDEIKSKAQQQWNELSQETKKELQSAYDASVKRYEKDLESVKDTMTEPLSVMEQIKNDILSSSNKKHLSLSDEDLTAKGLEKWNSLTEDAKAKLEETYQNKLHQYEEFMAGENAKDAETTLHHLKEQYIDKPADQIISKTKQEWKTISSEVGEIVETGRSFLYGKHKEGEAEGEEERNISKDEKKKSKEELKEALLAEKRKDQNKYGKT